MDHSHEPTTAGSTRESTPADSTRDSTTTDSTPEPINAEPIQLYLRQHYDAESNSVRIGTCKHKRNAFVRAAPTPTTHDMVIYCDRAKSHTWKDINLHVELAPVGNPVKRKKKITKRELHLELGVFRAVEEFEPGVEVQDTQMVRLRDEYKPAVRGTSTDGSQAEARDVQSDGGSNAAVLEAEDAARQVVARTAEEATDDAEVVPRPDLPQLHARDLGSQAVEEHEHHQDQPHDADEQHHADEPQDEEYGTLIPVPRQGDGAGTVAGLLHTFQDAFHRHQPMLVNHLTQLALAYATGNGEDFLPTLAFILPLYFHDLPPWKSLLVSYSSKYAMNRAISSPSTRALMAEVNAHIGLPRAIPRAMPTVAPSDSPQPSRLIGPARQSPTSQVLTMRPLSQDARRAHQALVKARGDANKQA